MEYFGRIMEWHTKLTDRKRAIYHLTLYRWPSVKKLALAEDTLAVGFRDTSGVSFNYSPLARGTTPCHQTHLASARQ